MGINSTQNSELLFIDNKAFSFTAPDSTNTIHIFYGRRRDFGNIYDFDSVNYSSFMPFGSITNFSVSKTTLAAYKLDDIEGIEIGDIYSLKIGANYDFYGKVTHLDTNNNIVTVSNFTEGTITDLSDAVMWLPYKPNVGTKTNGGAQHSEGYETTALNWASHSEGCNTLAEGRYSHAQNYSTIAGYAAHAEGQNTKALGEWSHAQGMATSALNRYTFSFGNSTVSMENYFNGKVLTSLKNEEIEKAWKKADPKFTCANGYASTAGGNNTLALGSVSTALGKETIAKGNNSLSTGYLTSAEGENSASFGYDTHAIGYNSIAFGNYNTAYGKNSIVFGYNNNNITDEWNLYTPTEGETYLYDDSPNNCIDNLQIEGSSNIIKKSNQYQLLGKSIITNSHIEGKDNKFDIRFNSEMLGSHIEGINNTVDGMKLNSSHVEGLNNNISYKDSNGSGTFEASHIEGYNNQIKTSVIQSHIEGAQNTIESDNLGQQVCVHVEGYNNKISKSNYSHTQGTFNTVTNSPSSHVGGWNNKITDGNGAFAHGHCLIVNGACNTSFGKYNAPVDKTCFSIGNGTDKNRSNAFLVYTDGHAELQTQGGTDNSIIIKKTLDDSISEVNDKLSKIPNRNKILDYITYEIVEDENGNKSVTITDCDSSISGNHIIPELIEGYVVTSIGNCAFQRCKSLTNITIPDTVTSIGDDAFSYCENLTSITLSDNVTSIADRVFSNCLSLESIVIPDSAKIIVWSAFLNCKNLKKVIIGSNLTVIEWDAFASCKSLTDVYYEGSKEDWDKIWNNENSSVDGNQSLLNANIHYNQELATKEFVLNNSGSGVTVFKGTHINSSSPGIFGTNAIELQTAKIGDLYVNINTTGVHTCIGEYDGIHTHWVALNNCTSSEYDPYSPMAMNGQAVAKAVQPKLEIWQPNKEYMFGDIVLRKHIDFADDGALLEIDCVEICNENHMSVEPPSNPISEENKNDKYWDSYKDLLLEKSVYAKSDFNGNVIDKTYATKDEVGHLLSGGLTRQIYSSLTDITPSEEFVNVIVMVPNTSLSGDIYDEYIVTPRENGSYYFEKIGSTAIDLTDYVTKEYVDSPKEYFLLKDSVTGENYKISIANGKLTIEVAE